MKLTLANDIKQEAENEIDEELEEELEEVNTYIQK